MKLMDEKLESYFNKGWTNEPWQKAEKSIPGFILKLSAAKCALACVMPKIGRVVRKIALWKEKERKERFIEDF